MQAPQFEDLADSVARLSAGEIAAFFVELADQLDAVDRAEISDALAGAYITGRLLIEDLADHLSRE